MNENPQQQEFLRSVRDDLEVSAANIDAQTQSRLNRIRQKALERASISKPNPVLVPAAALATACLTMAIIIYFPHDRTDLIEVAQLDMVDDLELLSSTDDLEFLEELEFYEWLETYEPQV